MDLLRRLQDVVATKFSLQKERITTEATLESLGFSSLEVIEMLFEVEDEFHIRIPDSRKDEATINVNTVQDVLDIIARLTVEQQPAKPV
jgi:acyl carrier protein